MSDANPQTPPGSDPRIPRPLLGYQQGRSPHQDRVDGQHGLGDGQQENVDSAHGVGVDPLGWCVIATSALLTWIFGPVALAVLSGIGFAKYWRAWRSGRTDSSCILGDVRLVLAYLAVLAVGGIAATIISVL